MDLHCEWVPTCTFFGRFYGWLPPKVNFGCNSCQLPSTSAVKIPLFRPRHGEAAVAPLRRYTRYIVRDNGVRWKKMAAGYKSGRIYLSWRARSIGNALSTTLIQPNSPKGVNCVSPRRCVHLARPESDLHGGRGDGGQLMRRRPIRSLFVRRDRNVISAGKVAVIVPRSLPIGRRKTPWGTGRARR